MDESYLHHLSQEETTTRTKGTSTLSRPDKIIRIEKFVSSNNYFAFHHFKFLTFRKQTFFVPDEEALPVHKLINIQTHVNTKIFL